MQGVELVRSKRRAVIFNHSAKFSLRHACGAFSVIQPKCPFHRFSIFSSFLEHSVQILLSEKLHLQLLT